MLTGGLDTPLKEHSGLLDHREFIKKYMTEQTENQFVYKDTNIVRTNGLMSLVLSGVFLLLIKYNIFSLGKMGIEKFVWFFLAVGLLMILFSSDLTVTADKSSRILHLRYRYPFFQRTKEIPFDDVADIQSQSSSGNAELTLNPDENYVDRFGARLVAILKDGKKIFFRRSFTPYVNYKEVAADLRSAITGSRYSSSLKTKSTEYALPIKMTYHQWPKVIYIFDIILFGAFAVWAYSSERDILSSLFFVFFALFGVYALINIRSTLEVDQTAITLSSPPHGIYRMDWRDVRYIETNGTLFVLIGDDKHLVFSLSYYANEKSEFLSFFNNIVQERKIELEPVTKIRFRQKNTKVS